LHDVEFVCTPFGPTNARNSIFALNEERTAYGLADGDEGRVRGEGDRKILEAIAELRQMQEEGLIKSIGITGV
jgi:D-arabinose 1-dehydrogenase